MIANLNCGCGRPIEAQAGPGPRRVRCEVCSPPRITGPRAGAGPLAVEVQPAVPPPTPIRPPGTPGGVAAAARRILAELESPRADAELLSAVAERLAGDIDDAERVGDRVAASRELRALLAELDAAPGWPPPGDGEEEDSNPLGIPNQPPNLTFVSLNPSSAPPSDLLGGGEVDE